MTHDAIEGVDITIPVYSFSETDFPDAAFVTLAYYSTLFNLTGKVNNASFKGLAAGECLFLGASGSKRDGNGTCAGSGTPCGIHYPQCCEGQSQCICSTGLCSEQ